ncbi:MAG: hypothetical protein H6634_09920 [Anaerolineales bacterium]|nr:hypothetical protein [Anaerolineales bacterium]
MTKITIDIHFVTGGMGSSGKTTALLNALCYFANKKYSESTSILVFDEGDNTDLSALWFESLQLQDLPRDRFGHDYSQLSMPGETPILAFEPFPQSSKGLKWSSVGNIISSYAETLDEGEPHTIIVLIDTGWSLASAIRNAGTMSGLTSQFKWHFFPWIIWTPNSLVNTRFIAATNLALAEFFVQVKKYGLGNSIHPIHIFNPVLQDPTDGRSGLFRQLAEFILPHRDRLIVIDSFLAYRRKPAKREIVNKRFFDDLEISFHSSKLLITGGHQPTEIYKIIGRTLNFKFVDRDCGERNGPCSYTNIFCIGFYDRDLAAIKLSPGILRGLLEEIKQKAISNGVAPVKNINMIFGEVYNAFRYNFELYYGSLDGNS